MAQLTTSQLIKIILGIFVVVVVIGGVFLFFKDTIIDFFKNLPGEEEEGVQPGVTEESEQQEEEREPERLCEDCKGGLFKPCNEDRCESISQELNYWGRGCEYVPPPTGFKGLFKQGQCNPTNTNEN